MKGLDHSEWSFDEVPDDELAACCLWEYARESLSFIVSSVTKMRDVPEDSELHGKYETFLDAYWNSDEGYMAYYETIRNHGGPDALPWQLIPKEIRIRFKQEVGIYEVSQPLAPALRRQLEALWKANLIEWEPVRNKPGYDPDEDMMAYEASHSHVEGPGHGGETHGETIIAFSVDFRKFNDKQIGADFAAWLKVNRPKDCPEPSQRGRKRRDLRVALDRLAIMRLLHHFTLREMPKRMPEAHRAFVGYEWYKERKRTLTTFRKLFPFLQKTERPKSWLTKGGRSK